MFRIVSSAASMPMCVRWKFLMLNDLTDLWVAGRAHMLAVRPVGNATL